MCQDSYYYHTIPQPSTPQLPIIVDPQYGSPDQRTEQPVTAAQYYYVPSVYVVQSQVSNLSQSQLQLQAAIPQPPQITSTVTNSSIEASPISLSQLQLPQLPQLQLPQSPLQPIITQSPNSQSSVAVAQPQVISQSKSNQSVTQPQLPIANSPRTPYLQLPQYYSTKQYTPSQIKSPQTLGSYFSQGGHLQMKDNTLLGSAFSPNEVDTMHNTNSARRSSYPISISPTSPKSGSGKLPITVSEMKVPRSRRKSHKYITDVTYPVNYLIHSIPENMRIITKLPNGVETQVPDITTIKSRKYATGVDERNFLTVYEYEINGQSIIWDYFTGYVHLTGIWKAVGHPKADIVRLLDSCPELEPLIKRVRGGFLKIQGTWVPFGVAQRLACRVCYHIRYALIPIFGESFPDQCLKPDQAGFGMLQLYYPGTNVPTSRISIPESQPSSPSALRTLKPKNSPSSNQPRLQSQQYPQIHKPHKSDNSHQYSPPKLFEKPIASKPVDVKEKVNSSTRSLFTPPNSGHSLSSPVCPPSPHRISPPTALSPPRQRINSTPGTALPFSELKTAELYESDVFEDDELDRISPPPMPRKVSFTNEEKVSESEILAMLKATRSLQQLSAGRHILNSTGGGFECGGKQFMWDGSDKLDVVKKEGATPILDKAHDSRMPTLTTILNM